MNDFRITQGKGFGMTFANGWGISVQWGYGNYCSNKDNRDGGFDESHEERHRRLGEGSSDAEVAAFNNKGDMAKLPAFLFDGGDHADTVCGYCTPAQVLELMNWVAAQPKEPA